MTTLITRSARVLSHAMHAASKAAVHISAAAPRSSTAIVARSSTLAVPHQDDAFTRQVKHTLFHDPSKPPVFLLHNEDGNAEGVGGDNRAVITPEHVNALLRSGTSTRPVQFYVESAQQRCFSDDDYRRAGAVIVDRGADGILRAQRPMRTHIVAPEPPFALSTKQPKPHQLRDGVCRFAFFHVHKGQDPTLLRQMVQVPTVVGGTPFMSIDYERLVDSTGARTVKFGPWAGRVGMIETLAGMGSMYPESPFARFAAAHQHQRFDKAKAALAELQRAIAQDGSLTQPFVFAFTGSGAVTAGAQEVLQQLQPSGRYEVLTPAQLLQRGQSGGLEHKIYSVHFGNKDRYATDPTTGRPVSVMPTYLPYIDAFINGIFWSKGDPRLLTAPQMDAVAQRGHRVIYADVTCDPNGSLPTPITTTDPKKTFSILDTRTGRHVRFASAGELRGLAPHETPILVHDRLPRLLPTDASMEFSTGLFPYLQAIASKHDDARSSATRHALAGACINYGSTLHPTLVPRLQEIAFPAQQS